MQTDQQGLLHSGRARLADAGNASLSLESRFDLAYNCASLLEFRMIAGLYLCLCRFLPDRFPALMDDRLHLLADL